MDKQTATQLIGNTFNFPFDEGRFRNFALNLLNDVDEQKGFDYISGAYIRHSFKNHISKYRRLGTYTDPNGEKIDVLVVQLKNEWALERSRTMLRNFTSDYLKNRDEKDAALVAYYTTNPDDWRFSYIRMEYKRVQTDSGKFKIKEDITPAKRYSFLVGKNEPNHTAQEQLVGILSDDRKNPTLSELENAFSVDAVTKQFYKDYRAQFEKLWNELNDIVSKDPKIAEEFETKTIDTANFAKKLMGQIVFLYFLQKKGWLGVGKDENGNFKEWGTGPKNFMGQLFSKEKGESGKIKFTEYGNFFNDVLEPLFYIGLASEHDGDIFPFLNCKIPFLNGGLFEPINDYNWEETDIRIDNDLIGDVLKTFDQYNFTVREDEPLEKEVAVDPEMLGKVFENLLPENLRKGKGAYYTPRTIVHYMCQESLINYLDSVIQSSRLNTGHKPAKKQRADKQDACNTLYFDYESLTKQQKRNLPHWEQDNVAYFVTFRLWDSIPKEVVEKIKEERKEWKNRHKIETEKDLLELNIELKKEYYRLFSKRMDDLLDNGHGSCVLKNPEVSKIVENALNHFDGERYLLDHWVIMPNHVHVLVKPLGDWSLEKITHSWKSFTSNEINKILKREGQLWMHESFDHIVRSPEQLLRIRQYIKDNPKNLPSLNYRMKCNSSILVETGHKPTKKQRADKQDACDTIPKEDIETLIREGDIILELETAIVEQGKKYDSVLMDSIKENAQALDDALANIKVCDPAIGSGAFPVGMLTEIVKARKVLSLYLKSNSSILLESGHKQDACDTYNLKRHCIQNSLYGVDIDPGAIEIAKLRLWLSLVVDEDDYTTIQPLPNLDYKIMQGNSLIEEFHGISLDIEKKNEQQGLFSGGSDLDTLIDDLHQKQDDFFNAEHPREKKQKRDAVETAIYNIFHNELEKKKNISPQEAKDIEADLKEMTHGNRERNFFPWKLYFSDIYRLKGGFDVVIGNPPYVSFGLRDVGKIDKDYKEYLNLHFNNSAEYKISLYAVFMELGIRISNVGGNSTFIVPDSFLLGKYFSKIRNFILKECKIEYLMLIKSKVFENATIGQSVIYLLKKDKLTDGKTKIVLIESGTQIQLKTFTQNSYDQNYFNTLEYNRFRMLFTKNDFNIIHNMETIVNKINISEIVKFRSGLISKVGQDKIKSDKKESPYWAKGIYSGSSVKRYFVEYYEEYLCYQPTLIKSGGAGTVKYFEPKIFVRQTGDRLTCGFDSENLLALNNVHIGNKITNWCDLKYIVALLNSNIVDFFYKKISLEEGRTMAQVDIEMLDKLPIPEIDKNNQKPFIKLVDQILTAKKANPQADTSKLEREIDVLVYDLYGLTDEEIAIVEASGE